VSRRREILRPILHAEPRRFFEVPIQGAVPDEPDMAFATVDGMLLTARL